jgi:predicted MFS family arabinose efflux permease
MKAVIAKTGKLYRDSYSGHPKEIWALTVLTIINRSGTMVFPFLSVYLTTILGFSLSDAGILISAFGFGSLAGSFLGGRFSDKIGAHNVIILSLLVSGFLFILIQFAHSFLNIFLMIFFTSLFGEAYRPGVMALAGEFVPPSQTGRTMSLIRLAINLGMAAGPAVGGVIAVKLGYAGLFWIDGLTCIVAAVYFWITSRAWNVHRTTVTKEENNKLKKDSLPALKNGNYILFLLATLLMGFCFIQWFHSVPVFIKTEWGFDEQFIGLMLAVNALLVALVEMPVIHFVEHAGRTKDAILGGLIFTAFSFLPFLMPPDIATAFFAIFLMTIGEILFLPLNSSSALNQAPKARRGEYIALFWMTWSLTNILGPTLGFNIIDSFGFSFFWICCGVITAVSLIINMRLKRKKY